MDDLDALIDAFAAAVLARSDFDQHHESLSSFWNDTRTKLDAVITATRAAIIAHHSPTPEGTS